jgi:ferritin-like metal-binding protein YciE
VKTSVACRPRTREVNKGQEFQRRVHPLREDVPVRQNNTALSNKGNDMSKQRSKASTTSRRNKSEMNEGEQGGEMNNDLHELFLDELADVYNAEQQLTKALPKLAKTAKNDQLREAFEQHLEETENHISRLDQVFESLGESMKRKKCKGMEGLVEEGEEVISEQKNSSALDAGLIISAQKVEHYEMAAYGSLCSWAEQMGHDDALELLRQTLEEEKATDEKLTEIAETVANTQAEEG